MIEHNVKPGSKVTIAKPTNCEGFKLEKGETVTIVKVKRRNENGYKYCEYIVETSGGLQANLTPFQFISA